MEFKIEIECKFCESRLDYTITGDLAKGITLQIEPCDRCTDLAMQEAWSSIKKRGKQGSENAES